MAPRGRTTRRAGLQRIDAAFDALIPLGFSRELIQKTIKNLLGAYGGDEGWVFIEEASYKLLIETILEQQEEEDQRHNNMEPEGENFEQLRGPEIREQVADAGSTSASAARGSGRLHSRAGYNGLRSRTAVDGRDDGRDYPKLLSVTYVDSYPDDHSTAEEVVAPGRTPHNNELPTRKRHPCYGWISETESDSDSDEER